MPPGVGFAVVRGASMEPGLRDGDLLLVRYGGPVRAGRRVVVRLGDVLAVKRAGAPDGADWWVESDNPRASGARDSWTLGRPVPAADVLGVVLLRLPRLRRPRPGY